MSYIISVIVSVLILGTLLRCTNYKVRKRENKYKDWDLYKFVDKGRFKFPVYIYIISFLSSLIFIWNYVYTIVFCIIWMILRFYKYEYNEGTRLEETKFYLSNKYIDKFIEFLNKGI